MTRYKGRSSPQAIERDFPNIVEIAVPAGGLGPRLDAMHGWHQVRGIESRGGRSRRVENGSDCIRWCFADAVTADAFATEFGGSRLAAFKRGRELRIEPMPIDNPVAMVESARKYIQLD